jgi:FemAB-related protein (PEP-CTERM system-associated)
LGTPFHLSAWKRSIEETFNYQPRYLVAEQGNELRGVLPLFLIRNWLTGRVLLSSPFAVYGGILADSPAALSALGREVERLGRELRVQHVELRNGYEEQRVGFQPVDRYATFTCPVADRPETELIQSLPKKTRNLVRKSLRYSYSSRFAENLDGFYDLLSRTYRRLGTPVFPKRFFDAICRNFGDRADVREVLLDGELAATSLNFRHHGQLHTYYAASASEHLDKSPNNFMYFDLLRWAGANGCTTFEFGRSKKETGNFEFKRHWGTTIRELPYEICLVERNEMPDFTPKNPRFQLALQLWRRLPLSVTRLVGPRLIHLFP